VTVLLIHTHEMRLIIKGGLNYFKSNEKILEKN